MQIGFNNDVEHNGNRYHIQTEDHGLKDGRITSQIFRGGQILDTKTVSYKKAIDGIEDENARDEEIRKRMKALHAHCFRSIKNGKFEEPADDEITAIDEGDDAANGPNASDVGSVGAEILDKPRMPKEPAPAPGLGGRSLSGLRQPPPLPADVADASSSGDGEMPKSLSDTAEDEAVVVDEASDPLADFVPDELADALVSELEQSVAKTAAGDHEDKSPTVQMTALPEVLPAGISVAGPQDEMAAAELAAYTRGNAMSEEEMAGEIRGQELDLDPMYSPQTAFRGLDIEPERDLPELLEALAAR